MPLGYRCDKTADLRSEAARSGALDAVRRRTLGRNFSWSLAGNALYAACQWAILMVLAKFGTARTVGMFALAMAVASPVILFANLHLRTVQATDACREYRFGDYLALRLIALALACLAISGIVATSGYSLEVALVVAMVVLAKVFDSLSDLIYGMLQQHERMDRIAQSRIIQGVLQVASLGIVLGWTGSLVGATAALAVASGLVTGAFDVPNALVVARVEDRTPSWLAALAGLRPRWEPRTLRRLAALALPLGGVAVLDAWNNNIPRYLLERYHGESAVGYYSALAYLMMTGGVVVSALGQTASTRLARYYVDDLPAFRRLTQRLIAVGALTGLGGVAAALVFGRTLLTLVYRADYAEYCGAFVWIMVAAALWYVTTFVYFAVTAARQFHAQTPLMVATVVVTALGCLWLVPRHGVDGAALAVCLGMAARTAGGFAVLSAVIHARTGAPARRWANLGGAGVRARAVGAREERL